MCPDCVGQQFDSTSSVIGFTHTVELLDKTGQESLWKEFDKIMKSDDWDDDRYWVSKAVLKSISL